MGASNRQLLVLGLALTASSIGAPAVVAGVQEAGAASPHSESRTLKECLSESAAVLERKNIRAVPIRALFIDGRTMPVDMMICVVLSTDSHSWYRLDRSAPDFGNASIHVSETSIAGSGGEVRELRASPDGKYLAVQYSAEGHTSVEVADLPALLRDNAFRTVGRGLGAYPGYVSIHSWQDSADGALTVASDVLLSHPTDGLVHLSLVSEELFSWDVDTGQVVPLNPRLRAPVQYYLAALSSPEVSIRLHAISELGGLRDQSAVPLLEQAFATESDAAARAEILEALNRLTLAAVERNGCLYGSRDELRKQGIVAEPIDTLFVDGQSQRGDEVLCIVNESRHPTELRRRNWFRVDRASPDRTSVMIQAGRDDPVDSLRPSHDGRYLAIRYLRLYEESIAYVEVVDLPALMRDNLYKPVQTIHRYPASVSITGWNDGVLEVTNDDVAPRR